MANILTDSQSFDFVFFTAYKEFKKTTIGANTRKQLNVRFNCTVF